jgi:hypothetical protein
MHTTLKIIAAAGLIGALAVANATPSQAAEGRNAAFAAGVGVGLLGGAVAGGGYGAYPAYGYGSGYAYGGPAYRSGYVYAAPRARRYHRHGYYR